MVALGRVVLTRREHVIALEPTDRGLLGLTLRYPYEVRDQAQYFEDIPELKQSKEMLDLATHIVNTKSAHFGPAQFEDRYENDLVDLLKKKEAGEKIELAKAGPAPRVVNLMDALRASINADKKEGPAPSVQARRPAKKKASQSDYRQPIGMGCSRTPIAEIVRRYFSNANGSTGCVAESSYTGAGDDLSIVAPFASQAAIIIEHTYMGAFSPHPKLLRGSDRE
jgi:hypothetical protein